MCQLDRLKTYVNICIFDFSSILKSEVNIAQMEHTSFHNLKIPSENLNTCYARNLPKESSLILLFEQNIKDSWYSNSTRRYCAQSYLRQQNRGSRFLMP